MWQNWPPHELLKVWPFCVIPSRHGAGPGRVAFPVLLVILDAGVASPAGSSSAFRLIVSPGFDCTGSNPLRPVLRLDDGRPAVVGSVLRLMLGLLCSSTSRHQLLLWLTTAFIPPTSEPCVCVTVWSELEPEAVWLRLCVWLRLMEFVPEPDVWVMPVFVFGDFAFVFWVCVIDWLFGGGVRSLA